MAKRSSIKQCELFANQISVNILKNLSARDFGVLDPSAFYKYINTRRVEELRLSKNRSIKTSNYSITWFSLDRIEERL